MFNVLVKKKQRMDPGSCDYEFATNAIHWKQDPDQW